MKVQKQYPLTSIVNIIYHDSENPVAFKLEFQKIEVTLEACDQIECIKWVDAIRKGTSYVYVL